MIFEWIGLIFAAASALQLAAPVAARTPAPDKAFNKVLRAGVCMAILRFVSMMVGRW